MGSFAAASPRSRVAAFSLSRRPMAVARSIATPAADVCSIFEREKEAVCVLAWCSYMVYLHRTTPHTTLPRLTPHHTTPSTPRNIYSEIPYMTGWVLLYSSLHSGTPMVAFSSSLPFPFSSTYLDTTRILCFGDAAVEHRPPLPGSPCPELTYSSSVPRCLHEPMRTCPAPAHRPRRAGWPARSSASGGMSWVH